MLTIAMQYNETTVQTAIGLICSASGAGASDGYSMHHSKENDENDGIDAYACIVVHRLHVDYTLPHTIIVFDRFEA